MLTRPHETMLALDRTGAATKVYCNGVLSATQSKWHAKPQDKRRRSWGYRVQTPRNAALIWGLANLYFLNNPSGSLYDAVAGGGTRAPRR